MLLGFGLVGLSYTMRKNYEDLLLFKYLTNGKTKLEGEMSEKTAKEKKRKKQSRDAKEKETYDPQLMLKSEAEILIQKTPR